MLEYGVDGQLSRAIKSFYCRPEVRVRVNGKQSKPFHVGVGLRQGCVLSPLFFIVYMNWIVNLHEYQQQTHKRPAQGDYCGAKAIIVQHVLVCLTTSRVGCYGAHCAQLMQAQPVSRVRSLE